tara:strand:- start:9314 stop:9769 length:456 start_codon:yes stop_codon:yes gene_type:complete
MRGCLELVFRPKTDFITKVIMFHEIQLLAGQLQYVLLAQEEAAADAQGPGSGFLILLLGFMVFMFMFSGRGAKKRRNEKNKMLNSIGKYSEVITIGGLCGTVIEVEETSVDGEEPYPTHFLIEVDSGSGSRIRVVAEAIGRVLEADDSEES